MDSNSNDNSNRNDSGNSNENGSSEKPRRRVQPVRIDLYHGPRVQVGGQYYLPEDAEEARRQFEEDQAAYRKELRGKWEQSREGKLCLELYAKFREYKRYLDEHPHARSLRDGAPVEYPEHKLFEQGLRAVSEHQQEKAELARKNLEKAQLAARCEHEYLDGTQCQAPRMKGKALCRMHTRLEEAKAVKLDLGPMEDPDSIQVGIKKLQAAVIDGKLDSKQITQLAYLIQLAAWNVTRTSCMERSGDREIR